MTNWKFSHAVRALAILVVTGLGCSTTSETSDQDSCTAPGETQCGASCANLQTSLTHCGACQTACGLDATCDAGICQPGGQGTGGEPGVGGTGSGGVATGGSGTGGGGSDNASIESCRGVLAVASEGGVYVGWRLKALDPPGIAFNVYRDGTLVNPSPVTNSTNLQDDDGTTTSSYDVRPVLDGVEQGASEVAPVLPSNYITIPLQNPEGKEGRLVGTADLDGDCDFDFIVKLGNRDFDVTQWEQDSEGETFSLEAYTNEGDFLWARDLGPNIRPGVWFSPMVVFDFDGDGKAELALKTGEIDESLGGEGDLNSDGITDYSDELGNVAPNSFEGNIEYLEVWDGETGETRARTPWIDAGPWGSDGNRYNRNMMAPAYLGGESESPSIVITRGGNSRNEIHAYDLVGDELLERWTWSIGDGGGNYGHNLRTGDIDGDGKDEFLFFGRALDNDGTEMWNTNEEHGDRFHLTDIDPSRPGLEVFYIQEFGGTYTHPVHLRDAANGNLIWGPEADWGDVGRGLCANIDSAPGIECWASAGDLYSATGDSLGARPNTPNMAIWWDADLYRELIDQNRITKVGGGTQLTATGCGYGSRNIPMGYGDVLGDWREEAWWLCDDNTELRVYVTTDVTTHRIFGLMQDPIYRTSIGAMMMGYVQASQAGFYIGDEMAPPPAPYVTIPAGQ